jgi:hypothetical protein
MVLIMREFWDATLLYYVWITCMYTAKSIFSFKINISGTILFIQTVSHLHKHIKTIGKKFFYPVRFFKKKTMKASSWGKMISHMICLKLKVSLSPVNVDFISNSQCMRKKFFFKMKTMQMGEKMCLHEKNLKIVHELFCLKNDRISYSHNRSRNCLSSPLRHILNSHDSSII